MLKRSAENSGKVETEDVQVLASVAIIETNDTKSDGESVDSSDQIETKDIQSPQNVTITATTDVTTNAKSNNAENSDKINIDSFSLLESIETRIKNLELQTDRYEYLHFVLFGHSTSIETINLTPKGPIK